MPDFDCDTLGVNPGERYDVLVTAERPGLWAFHCHILPHAEGMDGMFGMVTALVIIDPSATVTPAAVSASTSAIPFVCPIPTAG